MAHRLRQAARRTRALADCRARGEDPAGATAYVTLEPCCHYGKTPPCTEALVEAGVKRVVVGAPDPNPLVAGKGCAALREAGITVDEGVLLEQCLEINRAWFHYIRTGRPYVIMKYATTADGKIATHTGASQWLTGREAVQRAHLDRHRCAAILVGANTVRTDDARLTCRWEGAEGEPPATAAGASSPAGPCQPLRIVVDGRASVSVESALVQSASAESPVVVLARDDGDSRERVEALRAAGVEVARLPLREKRVSLASLDDGREVSHVFSVIDWETLLDDLGKRGVDSLIVEGGPTIHGSLARSGLVNEVHAYLAAKVFGGANAPGPVGGPLLDDPLDALELVNPRFEQLGNDVLVRWEVAPCSRES